MFAIAVLLGAVSIGQAAGEQEPRGAAGDRYEVAYHHVLHNKSRDTVRDVRVYLTVPASDDYQRIEGFRVETFGRDVHISNRRDEYGNAMKRVAIAEIRPGEDVRVGFTCEVVLRAPAQADVSRKSVKSYDGVDRGLIEHYTRDHNIFGLQTPIIRQTAAKLLQDHPDPNERAVAIHRLVADTFKYQRGDGWDAAPVVLERRSGSCSEFTHVFCALCRATGIPTRMAGASIVPAKRRLPYADRGWHRWPEAYLPDHGWVSFDPTLDRGRTKPLFIGTHHGRTLIVTRKGDRSTQLGLSYISSNSHGGPLKRSRYFVWSQGTMERLEKAKAMNASGDVKKARQRLERLVKGYGETRAGIEAARLLAELEGRDH